MKISAYCSTGATARALTVGNQRPRDVAGNFHVTITVTNSSEPDDTHWAPAGIVCRANRSTAAGDSKRATARATAEAALWHRTCCPTTT